MALGASAGDLSRLVLGEAAAVAACGALFGLPLGAVLYLGGLAVLESYQHFPFAQPSPAFMAIAAAALMLGVFVFSMLSAWLPALRLNRIEPGVVMIRGDFACRRRKRPAPGRALRGEGHFGHFGINKRNKKIRRRGNFV
jgi:putative ABC transport system permease protein